MPGGTCLVGWHEGQVILGPLKLWMCLQVLFLNQSNLFRLLWVNVCILSQQILFFFLSFRAFPLFLYHQTSWKHILHLMSMFTCPSCWLFTPYNLVCVPPSLCTNSHEVLQRSLNYKSSWLLSPHFLISTISCCFSSLPAVWKCHAFLEELRLGWRGPSTHLFLGLLLGFPENKRKRSSVTLKRPHTSFSPRYCHCM